MRKLFFIICLFLINSVFSQNYKAEYIITDVKKPQINDSLSYSYKNLMKYNLKVINEFSKVLKINIISTSDRHYFQIDEIMAKSDDYTINNKLIFALMDIYQNVYFDGSSTYYYFNSDKFVTKIESDDIEWKIKNGYSKTISGYECLLAVPVNNTEINFGPNLSQLKVWFCPDINLSSSPLIYGKLPGMLIALENKHIKLQLSNLEITDDSVISLNKFIDGKDIYSLDEANEYHEKVAKRIMYGRKRN